eukprot:16431166-Heterocapsa_arctica.AAC.1
MLFEWACEGDSKLAQWSVDHRHAAVRLHQWDLRNFLHVERAVALMQQAYVRGFQIFLWVSLPCTSWSSWQHVNAAISADVRARLDGDRRESIDM